MPNEEDVIAAIRDLDAQTGGEELRAIDVAKELGCASDDPDLQRYLVRAETTGLIEATSEVDQLPAPTQFRLVR